MNEICTRCEFWQDGKCEGKKLKEASKCNDFKNIGESLYNYLHGEIS